MHLLKYIMFFHIPAGLPLALLSPALLLVSIRGDLRVRRAGPLIARTSTRVVSVSRAVAP
jgi:hypothetical protein